MDGATPPMRPSPPPRRRCPPADGIVRMTVAGAPVKLIGLLAGPLAFVLLLSLSPPDGMTPAAWHTAAVGVWMATWWITEAIPIAATALLPLAAFPLL